MDVTMDTSDEAASAPVKDTEDYDEADGERSHDNDTLETYDGVEYRRSNSGGHSGKFTLRSSRLARLADPQHFIQRIRAAEQDMDIDPELEELITVLKTTDALDDIIDERDRSIFTSFITSTLVKQPDKATGSCSHDDHETGNLCDTDGSVTMETAHSSDDLATDDTESEEVFSDPDNDLETSSQGHLPRSSRYSVDEDVSQFEHANESGELPSPTDPHTPIMGHPADSDLPETVRGHPSDSDPPEPMSLKEELADQEEEKDGVSVDDDLDPQDEVMDTLSDLDFVSAQVWKAKEQAGSLLDLDLPSHGESPLNLTANKQKVQLRQRGSLAKRRKPTRSSIRTSSTTEATTGEADHAPVNGRRGSQSESSDSSVEGDTNVAMAAASQGGSVGGNGKTIRGVKTAIVRPEIVESGRQRLRSVPSREGPSDPRSAPSDPGTHASTPPWLLEARRKKSTRPPRGEAEKLQHEAEPETPSWMKDVLAKKKRSTEKNQSQASIDDPLSSPHLPSDKDSPPWLQETVQRKTHRSRPSSREVTSRGSHLSPDNSRSEVEAMEVDSPRGQTGVTNGVQNENHPPLSREPPAKKSLPALNMNLPPAPSNEEALAWKAEVALRRKSKAYIVSQKPDQPLKLVEMPQWKKDLVEKNKARRVSDGPDDTDTTNSRPGSGRFSDTPTNIKPIEIRSGARQAEIRPGARTVEMRSGSRSAEVRPNSDVPPWKLELDEKRKRQSVGSNKTVFGEVQKEPLEKTAPEEEPEWAQLVATRRKKLASSGLLSNDSIDDI